MSQFRVNAISDLAGSNGNAISLASDGTCTVKATNKSNRNLWINGACLIAQRSTAASSTNGIKTVDRYYYESGSTTAAPTFGQADVTSGGAYDAGFRKCVKITNGNQTGGAGTGTTVEFMYNFEAQDLANSGWNYKSASSYITLSFWVKSSVAQNFYGYFRARDGSAQMYSFDTGSLSANTWTKITKTIPGDSNLTFDNDNGNGLTISFDAYRGTSAGGNGATLHTWFAENNATRTPAQTNTWYLTDEATLEFTGFQMEVGDVATDFEHRSYTDELLRCYRYYYKIADGSVNTDSPIHSGVFYGAHNMYGPVQLPMEMRSTPSLDVVTGTDYYQCYLNGTTDHHDAISTNNITPTVVTLVATTNLTGTAGLASWCRTRNTSAYVALTAEL